MSLLIASRSEYIEVEICSECKALVEADSMWAHEHWHEQLNAAAHGMELDD